MRTRTIRAFPSAAIEQSLSPVVWEAAQRRGAVFGAWRVPLEGWQFPFDDYGWSNAFMRCEGVLRDSFRDASDQIGEIRLRYDLSRIGAMAFDVGPTVNGTKTFVTVGSNTSEVVSRRIHPEDFGYSAWVTNRAAEPNRRLVGFTVASPKGSWPVRLTVGDVPVLCDGKEEPKFALDSGAKYAFSVFDGEVPEITLLTTNGVEHAYVFPLFGYPVENMLGDMTVHWDASERGWICRKADVVLSEPDAGHIFQNDSCEISATVRFIGDLPM